MKIDVTFGSVHLVAWSTPPPGVAVALVLIYTLKSESNAAIY